MTTQTQRHPFVVAIDGPAASGKGTISKRLASELHLAHLDTGLLYRGVGWEAVSSGVDLADEQALAELAARLDLSRLAGNSQLRSDEAAVAASKVSSLPAVRAALLQAQRQFAAEPGPGFNGAVLDGRDVGTVVCPDAPVKLYATADVGVRAQRRLDELLGRGEATTYEAVLADMTARDARDMQRAAAPLKPADDAVLLDTTAMSIEEAYQRALAAVTAAQREQQQAAAVAAHFGDTRGAQSTPDTSAMDGTSLMSVQPPSLPAGGKPAIVNGGPHQTDGNTKPIAGPVATAGNTTAANLAPATAQPLRYQAPQQQQQQQQQELPPLTPPPSSLAGRPAVSKTFADVAPEIQELINTMLGIYSASSHDDLSRAFDRFKFNAEFDLPIFFVRGADRMRVLTNMLHIGCDKVLAEPRLVSMQMLENQLGCIAVEGSVTFFPRARHLPLLGRLLPRATALHVTWEIIATGDDDKIVSVKETLHNVPGAPRLLRGVAATALTTLGLPFSSW